MSLYLLVEVPSYRRLVRATEVEIETSGNARPAERIAQISGGLSSLLILVVIWLMVSKP